MKNKIVIGPPHSKPLRKSWKAIFLFSLLCFIFPILHAQDNTLYPLKVIPQSNQLNPAYIHPCRVYIELPVLSSIRLSIRNTGFGFHDAIHTVAGDASGTYSLDLENLDKKLQRMNYFLTQIDLDLLGFGFPVKDWYFTFGIIHHTSLRVTYPDDLVTIKDGNWDVSGDQAIPIRFNGLGFDFTAWNTIGISAARELDDNLTAGLRIKYIQGMGNFNTRRSKLELNTGETPISLEAIARYRLNASFPVTLGYDDTGLVNGVSLDNAFSNIVGDFIFNRNRGAAIDAGLEYRWDSKTSLSASITDLGFIRWKKNVNNFEARGQYRFSGIDIDSLQSNPDQSDLIAALGDSLFRAFTAEGSTDPYFTLTPVRIYGGIQYELFKDLDAGAMTRIEIYDLNIRPSFTFSLLYSPIPALTATVSYSLMNRKFDQIGAGLSLGRKGAQFYLLTDNIPVRFTALSGSPVLFPYNARMLSLRFGLNLLFGCNEKYRSGPQKKGRTGPCPAYW